MGKQKRLDSFFQKKCDDKEISMSSKTPRLEHQSCSQSPPKSPIVEVEEVNIPLIERDPRLRKPMWEHPINQRDEIRRAYLRAGPYQIRLSSYPFSEEKHHRRFQYSWFAQFSSWLEYSPTKDAAYCLPCYLFNMKSNGQPGWDAFIVKGFRSWKKINSRKNCAFLYHMGVDPCSPHNNDVRSCVDLMKQSVHIDKVIHRQNSEEILNNKVRVKTSIDVVRWLAFQACAFRGHDETPGSRNRGNFLELVELLASYNDDVKKVVLENAPKHAKYVSPLIQKEILHVIANKVRNKIREDIGDLRFCIIVDKARDESKKEQMALVLRFVDKGGFIREPFFDLAHVKDTAALTLKNEICVILARHGLDVQNICGQGYDGASNMRGEWKGLQALFLNDCPSAYYVHCFAHRLQLALVAASREVHSVHEFFNNLSFIINSADASCKRHEELHAS
ncbi:hypothetical protein like AT1G19260 [Hibiscus trionum]|uniref:TTF-type domain-containing protein n=1 Tax=Hibiscus trionum TaxID=183268 RepID=A0A9W7HID9_HIBTR|nr:hypothetical protein like AT1G19260 [Hibiscus trionum]